MAIIYDGGMDEKQKKPKRKQITVHPDTKAMIDRALGKYIEKNGYISIGAFCDMVISFALSGDGDTSNEERSDVF